MLSGGSKNPSVCSKKPHSLALLSPTSLTSPPQASAHCALATSVFPTFPVVVPPTDRGPISDRAPELI